MAQISSKKFIVRDLITATPLYHDRKIRFLYRGRFCAGQSARVLLTTLIDPSGEFTTWWCSAISIPSPDQSGDFRLAHLHPINERPARAWTKSRLRCHYYRLQQNRFATVQVQPHYYFLFNNVPPGSSRSMSIGGSMYGCKDRDLDRRGCIKIKQWIVSAGTENKMSKA